MSFKSALALKLGISDINPTFIKAYKFSFLIQNLLDINGERKLVLQNVKDYTHVNYQRLKFLYDVSNQVSKEGKQGAFVETGVWRGGCAGILSFISKKYGYRNPLYFFDSFEGLPEPTKEDGKTAVIFSDGADSGNLTPTGKVNADETFIKTLLFERLNIDPKYVTIVKEWFQDTLAKYKNSIEKIAILRLDGDWYESTKVPLIQFYDLVIPGGYIIIDDYYYWDGCKKAVDEFIRENNLNVKIKRQDSSGAYFVKP